MVSRSVTRMPWTNSPFLPSRASISSICGPPPCTTTGFMPTTLSSATSCAKLALSASSVMALPPYLTTMVLPVEAADVRQRFREDARLLRRLGLVVEGGVHAPPILQKNYWMVICLRGAACFFGSVSSSTPSWNLAWTLDSSISCGSVNARLTLP